MNQILCCDWLPEQARWSYLAGLGLPAVSCKKNFPESHIINPRSFSACLWTSTPSRSTKHGKKERGQYPAILTEQAWSIKDILYGFRGNFSCGTRRVAPSRQDSSILPARVANHSTGFDSSYQLTELAIA